LPKVVTQRCLEQDLNPRPTDRKPNCLTRCTTAPRNVRTVYTRILFGKVTYGRCLLNNVIVTSVVVCLFATLLCTTTSERICMKFSWKVSNGPLNKWLNFSGDPVHRLDTGIFFRIRHYCEIRKVVTTECAARRCSAGHALAGIAIATMASLRHRPTRDSHDRRTLAEVCTVSVLLVFNEFPLHRIRAYRRIV